ncbi:MAG: recombinase family protein [Oligoflexia bacterium]|nr:recombinase family protein [Oligoflexia bacterium]
MKVRVCAYARVSTILGQDPQIQLAAIRQVAETRGYELVEEFVDTGVSGARESRPALDQMLEAARHGRFKLVLVTALDRLGRDTRNLLNLIHALDGYGVRVLSLREGLDFSGPLGKAMLAVAGAMASLERDLTAERIRLALAMKKAAAEKAGRTWRCGRPSKRSRDLREKIEALRAEGRSVREIAVILKGQVGKTTIAAMLSEKPSRRVSAK